MVSSQLWAPRSWTVEATAMLGKVDTRVVVMMLLGLPLGLETVAVVVTLVAVLLHKETEGVAEVEVEGRSTWSAPSAWGGSSGRLR